MEASVSAVTGEAVSQVDKDYDTVRRFLEARSTTFQDLMRVQELVREHHIPASA